jgi:hypothetical protein
LFIHSQQENRAFKGADEQRLLSIPSQVLGIFGEDTEAKPKYNHNKPRLLSRGSRRLIKCLERSARMRKNHCKSMKKEKRNHKRHLSFLKLLRLFDGMPVVI